jgi:hypothetical protein
VKRVFGGFYKRKIIIINDLKIYISWFSRPIKRSVETTHALSLPGVMAHLHWAAFLMKKNNFTQSREAANGDAAYAQTSNIPPQHSAPG